MSKVLLRIFKGIPQISDTNLLIKSSRKQKPRLERFIQSPAAEWRRKARTGSRIQRRNVSGGKSSNPSSPECSCRSVCPHSEGRRGWLPPNPPAPIQPRLWDWRPGTGDSGPPGADKI